MDDNIKTVLNGMYMKYFSNVYTSKPELKSVEDTNYYYISNKDSNIICLLPLEYELNGIV